MGLRILETSCGPGSAKSLVTFEITVSQWRVAHTRETSSDHEQTLRTKAFFVVVGPYLAEKSCS